MIHQSHEQHLELSPRTQDLEKREIQELEAAKYSL